MIGCQLAVGRELALSNLLIAIVLEVHGQILNLAADQVDRAFFDERLAIAGRLDDDLVFTPALASGQLRGGKFTNFAGLLGFDTGQRDFGISRHVQRQTGLHGRGFRRDDRRGHWLAGNNAAVGDSAARIATISVVTAGVRTTVGAAASAAAVATTPRAAGSIGPTAPRTAGTVRSAAPRAARAAPRTAAA